MWSSDLPNAPLLLLSLFPFLSVLPPPAQMSLSSSFLFFPGQYFIFRSLRLAGVDLLSIPAVVLQRRERRARRNTAHVPTCKRWHLRGRGLWRSNEEGHCSFPTSNCLSLISDPCLTASFRQLIANSCTSVYTDACMITPT